MSDADNVYLSPLEQDWLRAVEAYHQQIKSHVWTADLTPKACVCIEAVRTMLAFKGRQLTDSEVIELSMIAFVHLCMASDDTTITDLLKGVLSEFNEYHKVESEAKP